MERAGDWVLEQMSIYIFNVGPEVRVYIGVCVCEKWGRVMVSWGEGAEVEGELDESRITIRESSLDWPGDVCFILRK